LYWLRALGIDVTHDGKGGSKISDRPERLEEEARNLSVKLTHGTWLRHVALEDEKRQFFGPGHRIIDGAYGLLEEVPHGRTTIFSRWLGPANKGVLFAMALFVTELPDAGEFPPGLVARARAVIGRDVHVVVLRCDPLKRQWEVERDRGERGAIALLERPFTQERGSGDHDLTECPNETLNRLEVSALEQAMESAQKEVQEQVRQGGRDYADELIEVWAEDFAYFDALMESNDTAEHRRAESERALRDRMLERVRNLTPRLDALALVVGGS
jgi:hypothetical protein